MYCERIASGETKQTCQEIGALAAQVIGQLKEELNRQ